MLEMPHAGDYHRQLVLHAIVNGILIPYRAPRLNECCNACCMSDLNRIIEWEERIAGQDRSMEIEIELSCFGDGLTHGIDATGLSTTLTDQLTVFYQGDGVRLEMFADHIRESEVFFFAVGGGSSSDFFPFDIIPFVRLLLQDAVEQAAKLPGGGGACFLDEQNAVLFRPEDIERVLIVCGGNEDLEEYIIDGVGCGLVDRMIAAKHAAESAFGIAGQSGRPGFLQRGPNGDATDIGVFDDGEDRTPRMGPVAGKFPDELYRCIYVHEVIVGKFLAVYLVEEVFDLAEKTCRLMRVFTVAERFRRWNRFQEIVHAAGAEIPCNDHVIMCTNLEGPGSKHPALFERRRTLLFVQQVHEPSVFRPGSDHGYIIMVFGRPADHRRSAYIDLFDDGFIVLAGRYRLLERIKVYDDQVYFGDLVPGHLFHVGGLIPSPKDTAKN